MSCACENIKIPNAALRFNPETVPNFPRPPKKKLDRPSADKADKIKTNVKKDKEGKVDKETVWILTEGDIPKPVRVTVGISGGNFTEMLKGDIKEGDRIITGVQSLSTQKKTKGGMGKRPGRPMRV